MNELTRDRLTGAAALANFLDGKKQSDFARAARTRFVATWIENHYGERLRAAVRTAYGTNRVAVEVALDVKAPRRECAAEARGPP